jgi:hypothetical protein
MTKMQVASEIQHGNTQGMEVLIPLLLMLLLAICAQLWGVDSRPVDVDRATRWFPGTPRD